MADPTCLEGGLLVGVQHPIPADPRIYYADSADRVGCNRLRCGACGQMVRHADGRRLARDLTSRAEFEALFAAADPGALPFVGEAPVKDLRLYYCRCFYEETAGASPAAWNQDSSWACAGHPQ